ncbi:mitochondrial import inner membrane translocase subunit TIM22 [Nadsonia fulvescens var. elongata DSM 6958]|uniref:Mitochondrial import inner membrane translocase subunit TIM22 n=1 Tax=Nadsonia fulvescens var. elongata DSM 6958 TaxID=857566 RepID=A0A1E3PSG2_9ASCO|nr:mitochondrial import inner membrane translocase subunit TIM22 [Nadsonia fulvescens var. elongata DSM 6958]
MSVFGAGGMGSQPPKPSYFEMTPEQQAQAGAEAMMSIMQSCPGKAAIAGVTGFGLGGVFGLFMASMAYDAPIGAGVTHISDLPFKKQMKLQFTDMGKRAWSSAKNFGYIGMIFSGTECSIEALRAKNDIWNGVAAGCLTGGGLAVKSGPTATIAGCAAFAAFSTAIDLYMRSDSNPPPTSDEDE